MIRVLVAEDMRILRDMLVSMLNLEDDIKVVAQVADGTGVVPAALADVPISRCSTSTCRRLTGHRGGGVA